MFCFKVHIFWESHKFLRNLHRRFVHVTVKSTVDISQNFVAFLEYMNFNNTLGPRIMQIHLVRNSTSARFGKKPFIIADCSKKYLAHEIFVAAMKYYSSKQYEASF